MVEEGLVVGEVEGVRYYLIGKGVDVGVGDFNFFGWFGCFGCEEDVK